MRELVNCLRSFMQGITILGGGHYFLGELVDVESVYDQFRSALHVTPPPVTAPRIEVGFLFRSLSLTYILCSLRIVIVWRNSLVFARLRNVLMLVGSIL